MFLGWLNKVKERSTNYVTPRGVGVSLPLRNQAMGYQSVGHEGVKKRYMGESQQYEIYALPNLWTALMVY